MQMFNVSNDSGVIFIFQTMSWWKHKCF